MITKAKYGKTPCAAKLLHIAIIDPHAFGSESILQKFERECEYHSMFHHPNIVGFLGTTIDPRYRQKILLMELMDESLTKFLERSALPLSYSTQIKIIHDVALALAYLHLNDFIHRDVTSNNVLLSSEGRVVKLGDFGSCRKVDNYRRIHEVYMTACPGAQVYMPPEALIVDVPCHYTSKLDCFSLGVITIQIATGKFPDPDAAMQSLEDERYPTDQAFVRVPEVERRKKHIDMIEPNHPILPLALDCLSDKDVERPASDKICERLSLLKHKALDPYQYKLPVEPPVLEYNIDAEHVQGCVERFESSFSLKGAKTEYETTISKYEQDLSALGEELDARTTAMEQLYADFRAELQLNKVEYEKKLTAREDSNAQLHKENLKLLQKQEQYEALNIPVNLTDANKGLSPLMIASRDNSKDVVLTLLSCRANINLINDEGRSALMHASERGHTDLARLLVKRGAFVNLQDHQGFSALMMTCVNGHAETASMLVEREADVYLKNKTGRTALDFAMKSKNPDMLLPFTKLRCSPQFPGILFSNGAKRVTVTAKEQTIDLREVGILLTIPKDALSSADPPLEVLVQPCFSGPFQVPENLELVSPIYIVKPSKEVVFRKEVMVKIWHHANLETEQDCEEMKFLSASTTPEYCGTRPVYVFREIKVARGSFRPGEELPAAEIALKHFCSMSVSMQT